MGGEELDRVDLDARGVAGDRWHAVNNDAGHFASGKNTRRFRRRDAVFDYTACTAAGGRVVVGRDAEQWVVGDPNLDRHLSQRMGVPVTVVPEAEVPHQDMGSVSLVGSATLDWCASHRGGSGDPRRLRVNVVVETGEPFIEERWQGHQLSVDRPGWPSSSERRGAA